MASARVFNHVLHSRHTIALRIPSLHKSCCSNLRLHPKQNAFYSTNKSMVRTDPEKDKNQVQVGTVKVVKEGVKTVTNFFIVICGGAAMILIIYTLWKELFSSNSVQGIYKRAFERCMKDHRVADALGSDIKAYGEESRRGRRNHVSHVFFKQNEETHLRMKFYMKGSRRRGVVLLEMKENKKGDFEYVYLYVTIEDILKTVIKIEDNRLDQYTSTNEVEPLYS